MNNPKMKRLKHKLGRQRCKQDIFRGNKFCDTFWVGILTGRVSRPFIIFRERIMGNIRGCCQTYCLNLCWTEDDAKTLPNNVFSHHL